MSTTVRWTLLLVLALTVCFARVGHAQLVERPLIAGRHAVVTSDGRTRMPAMDPRGSDGGSAFDAAVASLSACSIRAGPMLFDCSWSSTTAFRASLI